MHCCLSLLRCDTVHYVGSYRLVNTYTRDPLPRLATRPSCPLSVVLPCLMHVRLFIKLGRPVDARHHALQFASFDLVVGLLRAWLLSRQPLLLSVCTRGLRVVSLAIQSRPCGADIAPLYPPLGFVHSARS